MVNAMKHFSQTLSAELSHGITAWTNGRIVALRLHSGHPGEEGHTMAFDNETPIHPARRAAIRAELRNAFSPAQLAQNAKHFKKGTATT